MIIQLKSQRFASPAFSADYSRFELCLFDRQTLDITKNEHIQDSTNQRHRCDVKQRRRVRVRQLQNVPDDDRRQNSREVGEEVENASGETDYRFWRDVRNDRPAKVADALTEKSNAHDRNH